MKKADSNTLKKADLKKDAPKSVKRAKSQSETSARRGSDYVKWALVAVILAAGMVANIYYEHISPSLRLVVGIIGGIVMLLIAWQTSHGQKAWKFCKEARNEIRRVSWPTRQQTMQVTMVVAIMVAVAAVAIFILDQIFMWLISLITG